MFCRVRVFFPCGAGRAACLVKDQNEREERADRKGFSERVGEMERESPPPKKKGVGRTKGRKIVKD